MTYRCTLIHAIRLSCQPVSDCECEYTNARTSHSSTHRLRVCPYPLSASVECLASTLTCGVIKYRIFTSRAGKQFVSCRDMHVGRWCVRRNQLPSNQPSQAAAQLFTSCGVVCFCCAPVELNVIVQRLFHTFAKLSTQSVNFEALINRKLATTSRPNFLVCCVLCSVVLPAVCVCVCS